ncbi:hypothetical protein HJC23_006600 [Cyclotella cryptica]|uniref:Uncharacterized protein n=1 Tax=Cyclotella cryptica TaxID=29204 RepID=A0ABD3QWI5_9STRA|eukprot:CCRYP_001008-RA/>CCRYP_001008-RA protein AED:0.11 eAED:0.11 QI:0/-1/0/1/-1/1/1/0/268
MQSLSGHTYCEILWGSIPSGTLTVSWNGTGGVCPTNPGFYNVTEDDVRAIHGDDAQIIIWNGVRQWMLDEFQEQKDTSVTPSDDIIYTYGAMFSDGGGFEMRKQATLPITSSVPYKENQVTRNVTAVWKEGSTVYELVAPNCQRIYTMQSFMIGRPGDWYVYGGDGSLPYLFVNGNISLPDGWIYRNRTLEADLVIKGVNGTSAVLQDDLRNSYSGHDMPLDASICPHTAGQQSTDEESDISGSTSVAGKMVNSIITSIVIVLMFFFL